MEVIGLLSQQLSEKTDLMSLRALQLNLASNFKLVRNPGYFPLLWIHSAWRDKKAIQPSLPPQSRINFNHIRPPLHLTMSQRDPCSEGREQEEQRDCGKQLVKYGGCCCFMRIHAILSASDSSNCQTKKFRHQHFIGHMAATIKIIVHNRRYSVLQR